MQRFVMRGGFATAALLIHLLTAAGPAGAQTSTGNIRGTVRDEGGAPIEGAVVVATETLTNARRGTETNESGFYNLAGLRPGTYRVDVSYPGRAAPTRTVRVRIGQTVTQDLAMAEAAIELERIVAVGTRSVETRTSEVGTNISQEQIENLPNFERNFLDIARLAPGISAPVNPASSDKTIAAVGQPAEAVNVFIDGATYKNDVLRGGVVGQDASKGNPFPQGAVQEFRVLTQNYKAEYQKAASAIITASTRSGSNDLTADAFAYGVGKSYVARDAITAREGGDRPDYQRLQAGGSIGGPIVRDKLFFFGTYELNFRDEPAYVRLGGDSLLLPAAVRQELQSYTGQFTQQFREHLGFGKLTWNANDRNTVEGSINLRSDNDFRGFGGNTAADAAENMHVTTSTGVANWARAGDTWLNQAQVSAQLFRWNPTWRNRDAVGRNYFGALRVGGKDTQQDFTQNRLSLRNDLTRSPFRFAGDHVAKGGVSVDFLSYEGTKYQFGNPVFNYRSDENYERPFQAQFGFGDPTVSSNNVEFGAYVQDDWSITSRLVLNLGIRWDAETNMINNDYVTPQALADSLRGPLSGQFYVDQPLPNGETRRVRVVDELGGIDRYISSGRSSRPMYLKQFQPRLGASYDLFDDGATVLFGGYGIYYDRNYWNTLYDEQYRRRFRVLTVEFRDECGAPDSPSNCAVWDPKYFDPEQLRTLSGSAGRPEVFLVANDLRPPRTEQFSAGVRQRIAGAVVSVSYNGVRGHNFMNYVRATPWGGLGPNYAQAFVTDDRVRTWYDAMQLQIERPLVDGRRWGGSIAYTLGRAEEQGQSQDIFWGFDDRYPTVADRPRLRAPGDQTHNIVANAIVLLPWELRFSSIASFGSGVTINATNASRGWEPYNQFTYVYAPPTRPFLGIGHVFATQNVDLRIEKLLPFSNGQNISVLADLFNAFNSANYGCFNTTITPTNGPPNANYGTPGCAGLGRRLQIGVRYGYGVRQRRGT